MTDDEGQAFFARIEYLEQQLAECQAREKVLREALYNCYGTDEDGVEYINYETIKQALTMPSDYTALD